MSKSENFIKKLNELNYIDKNNDDILLKGNKSGKTVNTGDKFK